MILLLYTDEDYVHYSTFTLVLNLEYENLMHSNVYVSMNSFSYAIHIRTEASR